MRVVGLGIMFFPFGVKVLLGWNTKKRVNIVLIIVEIICLFIAGIILSGSY